MCYIIVKLLKKKMLAFKVAICVHSLQPFHLLEFIIPLLLLKGLESCVKRLRITQLPRPLFEMIFQVMVVAPLI